MSSISGISVKIQVGSISWAESDDRLYLGVFGKKGGREFSLDVTNYNEFDTVNKLVKFKIGDGCCSDVNELLVNFSNGQCNTPITDQIDLNSIEFVYLRKEAKETESQDNCLQLKTADVKICDTSGNIRRFKKETLMYFGHECGLQHFLIEGPRPGCNITVLLHLVGYSGDNIGNDIEYKFEANFNNTGFQTVYSISEHNFSNGHFEFPVASKSFFIPGCCGKEFDLLLRGYVKEHDVWFLSDDIGDETEDYKVTCKKENNIVPFTFDVNVYEGNDKAVFTFMGFIIATCIS